MNIIRFFKRCLAASLAAAALSCTVEAGAHEPASENTATQAPKARKPPLGTGAAFDPEGRLWIVGLNDQGRLFLQRTEPGVLWPLSAPALLDTGSDAISADGENRPKIAFGPNAWAVISYTQPLAKPYTGLIRMLRSTDAGGSFSAPFTVHQDRQEITHRFESIAFDASGTLHTLWIDKRDQPPAGSVQKYLGAAIYRNTSSDGGATFSPDTKLADHTCECCRISVASNARGTYALWRHIFGEQTRDHAFAALTAPVSAHAPTTITRATEDGWQINACPHHGPGLADAEGGGFHAVWFGIKRVGKRDEAAVRYGRLQPDGTPLADTIRALPDPRAEHADVAANGHKVAVVWRSSEGHLSTLKAWVSSDGGRTFKLQKLAEATGYNDHPRLVQTGPRMVVVWRQTTEIQVHEIAF